MVGTSTYEHIKAKRVHGQDPGSHTAFLSRKRRTTAHQKASGPIVPLALRHKQPLICAPLIYGATVAGTQPSGLFHPIDCRDGLIDWSVSTPADEVIDPAPDLRSDMTQFIYLSRGRGSDASLLVVSQPKEVQKQGRDEKDKTSCVHERFAASEPRSSSKMLSVVPVK